MDDGRVARSAAPGQEDAVRMPEAWRSGRRLTPIAGPIVCEAAAGLLQRRRGRHRRHEGHARDPHPLTAGVDPITTQLVSAVRIIHDVSIYRRRRGSRHDHRTVHGDGSLDDDRRRVSVYGPGGPATLRPPD